jgi:hypothetical protein
MIRKWERKYSKINLEVNTPVMGSPKPKGA